MKIFIWLFFIGFLLASPPAAQQKPAGDAILRVEGEKSLELKASDLGKLPRGKLRITNQEINVEFEGVPLRDVLKLAGVKIGNNQLRGAELAKYLLVEAADGYKAVFALAELDEEFTNKSILLADMRDGKPLSEKEGRWRLVVPDEKKQGRWVRQVVRLTIKKAE